MNSFCEALKISCLQPTPSRDGIILNTEILQVNLNFTTRFGTQIVAIYLTQNAQHEVSLDSILNENPSELVKITADVCANACCKPNLNVRNIGINGIDTSKIDAIDLEAYYTLDPSWDYALQIPVVSAVITDK